MRYAGAGTPGAPLKSPMPTDTSAVVRELGNIFDTRVLKHADIGESLVQNKEERMSGLRRFTVALSLILTVLVLTAVASGYSRAGAPATRGYDAARASDLVVSIEIAPATLVLDSPGTWVTVHAEIGFSEVDHPTVALEGVSPVYVKADNRGDLVAKFARDDIVSIVAPPEATLTLRGLTVSGASFSGTDTIVVQ